MYDLTKFTLRDMTECGIALRKLHDGTANMEEVANRIVDYFYKHLIDKQSGENSCALVRFFKTHPYEGLNPELRQFADGMLPSNSHSPKMKCLTLLATAGVKPEWNSKQTSDGHKAIPLAIVESDSHSPVELLYVHQMSALSSTLV